MIPMADKRLPSSPLILSMSDLIWLRILPPNIHMNPTVITSPDVTTPPKIHWTHFSRLDIILLWRVFIVSLQQHPLARLRWIV